MIVKFYLWLETDPCQKHAENSLDYSIEVPDEYTVQDLINHFKNHSLLRGREDNLLAMYPELTRKIKGYLMETPIMIVYCRIKRLVDKELGRKLVDAIIEHDNFLSYIFDKQRADGLIEPELFKQLFQNLDKMKDNVKNLEKLAYEPDDKVSRMHPCVDLLGYTKLQLARLD
jgi:hypothetical protein